jgi:hypothetical protein
LLQFFPSAENRDIPLEMDRLVPLPAVCHVSVPIPTIELPDEAIPTMLAVVIEGTGVQITASGEAKILPLSPEAIH